MLSKIACLILGMCFLLPVFPGSRHAKAAAETESEPVTEIISSDKAKMTASLSAIATSSTPFDESTRQPMPGCSVTPASDEHGQIHASYIVSQFELDYQTSVYMWIYFPDDPLEIYYSLSIGFYNSREQFLRWEFDPQSLHNLMDSPFYEKFGWKKIELVFSDAEASSQISEAFNRIELSYNLAVELPNYPSTSGTVSIYDAYAAERSSESTCIIENTSYYHYSFSSEFNGTLKSLSPGDNIQLSSLSKVFGYVYVGKNNLLAAGTQNNRYIWSISVSHNGEVFSQPDFSGGNNSFIFFKDAGDYRISFKLEEQRNIDTKIEVFVALKAVQVTGFRFGAFSNRIYELEQNETRVLTFEVSSDIEVDPQKFSFSVSNEKVASIDSVEYNAENNVFYITVSALKPGEADITAEVILNDGGEEKTFSNVSTISVYHNGINSWMLYTLYATLAACGLAIVIFLVISFVNARKNGVK